MLKHERATSASPATVWSLYAEPARWKEWAPQVRSPKGLGDTAVTEGAQGSIRLGGALPVAARIISVDPGRSWSWKVGPVVLDHGVRPAREGSVIEIGIEAPRALETAMRAAYLPVVRLVLANLARVAERETAR
ncbi:hypothetical protein BH10ACT11_BH10ACT11_14790 [soil metagenome]